MNVKRSLISRIRGWLPKDTVYMHRSLHTPWRRPSWIAVTLIAVFALAFAVYAGAQTYIRYSNPRADVTASYFEKVTNCSSVNVGDVVEVKVVVGWHGHIFPEFKRQVQIIDSFPESIFQLVGGNNTYQYSGYGGANQFTYQLKVISDSLVSLELPEPKLYLDNADILLQSLD